MPPFWRYHHGRRSSSSEGELEQCQTLYDQFKPEATAEARKYGWRARRPAAGGNDCQDRGRRWPAPQSRIRWPNAVTSQPCRVIRAQPTILAYSSLDDDRRPARSDLYNTLKPVAVRSARSYVMHRTPHDLQDEMAAIIMPTSLRRCPNRHDAPFISQAAAVLSCTLGNWNSTPSTHLHVASCRVTVGLNQATTLLPATSQDNRCSWSPPTVSVPRLPRRRTRSLSLKERSCPTSIRRTLLLAQPRYEPPPVVDPLAWPVPPTTGQPVLSAADQAAATALFNQLKPVAQTADLHRPHTPSPWQDFMIRAVGPSVAPKSSPPPRPAPAPSPATHHPRDLQCCRPADWHAILQGIRQMAVLVLVRQRP
jgi:hypothetical protein